MPRVSSKPSLAKSDYELLAKFRYILRRFLGFSEAAALALGVTAQQYQAMLAIQGFPGRTWVTIGELAEQMQIVHHSAVGLVDRMQALRLVRRAVSPEDRRQVRVSLTAKGLATLERLYRTHRQELQSTGPELIELLRCAAMPVSDATSASPKLTAGKNKKNAGFSSPPCSMPDIED